MSNRDSGKINHWNQVGAYGFIRPDDPDLKDVFVHTRQCEYPNPERGDKVTFVIGIDQRTGKSRAEQVRLVLSEEVKAAAGMFKAPKDETVSGAALADWLTRDQK